MEDHSDKTRRRSFLKTAAIGVVGIASGSGISAADTPVSESAIPVSDPSRIEIDDEVKAITSNWFLLTTRKDSLDMYLRRGSKRKYEYNRKLDTLKNIWDNYPIVRSSNGNTVNISLSSEASSDILDPSVSGPIAETAYRGFGNVHEPAGDVSVQWTPNMHGNLLRFAGEVCNDHGSFVSSTTLSTFESQAGKPDEIDNDAGAFNGTFLDGLGKVVQSEKHYYNDEPGIPGVGHFGSAPQATQTRYDKAKSAYDSDEWNKGDKFLAYATHTVSDMGQPLHTGMGAQQISDYAANGNDCVHFVYESWAASQFDEYKSEMDNGYSYDVTDAKQATIDLASASRNNAETVFQSIMDNGIVESDLEDITRNRIARTGLYLKGFIFNHY